MSGFSTSTTDHLTRSNVWSKELKEILEDELIAQRWVRMLEFPDGDTLNIPSIGQHEVSDYTEGTAVKYTAMDTGNFTFTIGEYKSAATYITNKQKQDMFYMNELVSSFVPKQRRALMKAVETKILATGPDAQTASDLNNINGAAHRWVGSGTNEILHPDDFAKARYALQKANVPLENLIAIVDPSAEYAFATTTNISNLSNNPMWQGVIAEGFSRNMKFRYNIHGFDVYVSNNLKVNTASETIDSVTAAGGVNNLMFSASSDVTPFVGAWRQLPKVDSEYNKDLQREEYVTTARYDYKLYRPENMVVVLTDTDQV